MVANTNKTSNGSTSMTLDNVVFDEVKTWLLQDNDDGSKKGRVSRGKKKFDLLVVGRTYDEAKLGGKFGEVTEATTFRPSGLTGDNPLGLPKKPFFERQKPQYEGSSPSDFVHAKNSCKGTALPVSFLLSAGPYIMYCAATMADWLTNNCRR